MRIIPPPQVPAPPSARHQRCQQGRIEEETLRAELSALDDAADDLVPEPATVTDYLRTVTELRARAKRGTVEVGSPEAVSLRALVKSVVLVPRRDEGRIEVEITARLRPLCRKPKGSTLSGGTMVAEAGFGRVKALDLPSFVVRVPLGSG